MPSEPLPDEPVSDDDGVPTAVVVGGGIGGLVAARALAAGGVRVTLVEASDRLGGKVARHTVAGIDLDAGAESFATRGGTVAELAEKLGLGVLQPNPAGAWLQPLDGAPIPMPKTGLLGIPGVPLASDVIESVGIGGALRAQLDQLMFGYLGSRERTLGGLVRRRMGRKVLERLVAPVTLGVHSRHPDELEVDVVAPALRKTMRELGSLALAVRELRAAAPAGSAVQGIDGGIYELVDALRRDLDRRGVELRLQTRVAAVDALGVTLADGEQIDADAVVLATPLSVSGPDAPAPASIVLATLVLDLPALDAAPRGTGLLVAAGAPGIRAKALTHSTAKWPWLAGRAGEHRHVVRLSYDPARVDGSREQARTDAEKLLGVPIPAGSILGFDRVEWAAPAARTAPPDGVALVGEAAAGVGLAAVVTQAQEEAGRLLEAFGARG